MFAPKKKAIELPLPKLYWKFDTLIPFDKDWFITKTDMNSSWFLWWIIVDSFQHKTIVFFIFGDSQQIIFHFISFNFDFSFSEHDVPILVEPEFFLFPSFDIEASGVSNII